MKTCTYACQTAAHDMGRRAFFGNIARAGAGAAFAGLGLFASPAMAAELVKQQKRMLIVRMAGGLSQLESWDPKPGTATGGPFRAIPTSVPGLQISELLPYTAITRVRNPTSTSIFARSNAGLIHGPPNLNFSPPIGEKPPPSGTGRS